MAEGNIEIVERVYESWGRGDFASGTDVLDPHVLMVVRSGFPDTGTYLGLEGIAEYTRGFLEPWSRITIEAEEIIPAGDSVVVATLQRGEGDASGAVTEFRYFHVWTFRGGRAIRLETVRERDEALEAVGLASA
jgi:ketosteroid isomerase-like protein